jgi:hypothetical protein
LRGTQGTRQPPSARSYRAIPPYLSIASNNSFGYPFQNWHKNYIRSRPVKKIVHIPIAQDFAQLPESGVFNEFDAVLVYNLLTLKLEKNPLSILVAVYC